MRVKWRPQPRQSVIETVDIILIMIIIQQIDQLI